MPTNDLIALGFDFGTESVRVLAVNVHTGRVAARAVEPYPHGVIDRELPGSRIPLPPDFALQHPQDWLTTAARACRQALHDGGVAPDHVVGIGVDFTSCTMLPCLRDGTPLCLTDAFAREPHAWPKLWKHHGAHAEADRINAVARERNEPWLPRYGGVISLEWFFPKVLETLNRAPAAYDAADVWLEAGDWFVWQLTSGPYPYSDAAHLVRSTCQAGYKAMWNAADGYPSRNYLGAVHPRLAAVVADKMPAVAHRAPGEAAGALSPAAAEMLGLRPGVTVAAAVIDAHAGVPGAGVATPGTLVMVLGTSACHMVNATDERLAPGIAGVVDGGILPGLFGYETGQASVGDAFAWVARMVGLSHADLSVQAAALPPGADGVLAVDWLNGCRTPLMDARLSGAFVGLTLGTRPEQLYRAMLESTAFGVRTIVQTLRDARVPVTGFVASGGLPGKSPLLMQIIADVLNAEVRLAASDEPVALGAAILGCLAAGPRVTGHADAPAAIAAMARQREDLTYRPAPAAAGRYEGLYGIYKSLTARDGELAGAMRGLRNAAVRQNETK